MLTYREGYGIVFRLSAGSGKAQVGQGSALKCAEHLDNCIKT